MTHCLSYVRGGVASFSKEMLFPKLTTNFITLMLFLTFYCKFTLAAMDVNF